MEFRFNLNELFKQPIVEIGNTLIPPGFSGDKRALWDTQSKITQIVNAMGEASAHAQGLSKPITTADRLRNSEHRLYLLVDHNANSGKGAVTGMLKTGEKGLYVFDREGQHYQVSPPCVLDFYVHESRQRSGLGKRLFEHMLQRQQVEPVKMAIDRPSDKFLGFLNKHYGLSTPVKQMNNYVVFDGFFPKPAESARTIDEDKSHTPTKKQSANGLQQGFPSSPYGRYGAPRPPCSMGQIIHNDTPVIKRNQEPTGVRSEPVTNVHGSATNNNHFLYNGTPNPTWQATQSVPNMYYSNQTYPQYDQTYQTAAYPQSSGDFRRVPEAGAQVMSQHQISSMARGDSAQYQPINQYSNVQQQYYSPQAGNQQPPLKTKEPLIPQNLDGTMRKTAHLAQSVPVYQEQRNAPVNLQHTESAPVNYQNQAYQNFSNQTPQNVASVYSMGPGQQHFPNQLAYPQTPLEQQTAYRSNPEQRQLQNQPLYQTVSQNQVENNLQGSNQVTNYYQNLPIQQSNNAVQYTTMSQPEQDPSANSTQPQNISNEISTIQNITPEQPVVQVNSSNAVPNHIPNVTNQASYPSMNIPQPAMQLNPPQQIQTPMTGHSNVQGVSQTNVSNAAQNYIPNIAYTNQVINQSDNIPPSDMQTNASYGIQQGQGPGQSNGQGVAQNYIPNLNYANQVANQSANIPQSGMQSSPSSGTQQVQGPGQSNAQEVAQAQNYIPNVNYANQAANVSQSSMQLNAPQEVQQGQGSNMVDNHHSQAVSYVNREPNPPVLHQVTNENSVQNFNQGLPNQPQIQTRPVDYPVEVDLSKGYPPQHKIKQVSVIDGSEKSSYWPEFFTLAIRTNGKVRNRRIRRLRTHGTLALSVVTSVRYFTHQAYQKHDQHSNSESSVAHANGNHKADRPNSLNIEPNGEEEKEIDASEGGAVENDDEDKQNKEEIDLDEKASDQKIDDGDSLDGDAVIINAMEQMEIQRVETAPNTASRSVSRNSRSPGIEAAGIVTPGRSTPGLTGQGYFDLKFYHNKLW